MPVTAFKVKNVPPPGKKRIGDWVGLRVKLKRELTNGYATFPVGTNAVVSGTGNGLHLKIDACECCGIAGHITRIHGSDVEVVDENFAPTPTVAADAVAPHSDDLAVDAFAAAMKDKLAQARAKGRSGWETCDPSYLSHLLREHVEKGDPRDVANFCMMLHFHRAPIGVPAQPDERMAAEQATDDVDAAFRRTLGLRVRNLTVNDKNEVTWIVVECRGVESSLQVVGKGE